MGNRRGEDALTPEEVRLMSEIYKLKREGKAHSIDLNPAQRRALQRYWAIRKASTRRPEYVSQGRGYRNPIYRLWLESHGVSPDPFNFNYYMQWYTGRESPKLVRSQKTRQKHGNYPGKSHKKKERQTNECEEVRQGQDSVGSPPLA
jgi:hypothetical protein